MRWIPAALTAMSMSMWAPVVAQGQVQEEEAPGEQSPDPALAEARAEFEAGQVAFEEGSFAAAYSHFQRSYELSEAPLLLYNIGASAERIGRTEEAVRAYRGYLEAFPEADDRAEVQRRVAALERLLEDGDGGASEEPDERPDPPELDTRPPPEDAPSRTRMLALAVGGAALVAGAGALLGVSIADANAVRDPAPDTRWSDVENRYDRIPILQGVAIGAGVIGAALIVLGVVLGPDEGERDEPTVRLVGSGLEARF